MKIIPIWFDRLSDRWISMLLVAASLGLAAWLLINQVRITQEDGFYYFKIAQHIAHGDGSTFDGINPTNGYHPLWLWCLTLIFIVVTDPQAALVAGTLMQAVFMSLTVLLIYHTARWRLGRTAAILAAFAWLMLTYRVSISGLEFSVHALGVAACAYVFVRWFAVENPRGVRPYWMLGILLSLTFLARIDTLLLAITLGLVLVVRAVRAGIRSETIKPIALFALPIAITAALYFVGNLAWFGQPWSISSVVKSDWSIYRLGQDPIFQTQGWLAAKLNQVLWPLQNGLGLYPMYVALGTWGAAVVWLITALSPRVRSRWQWLGPFVIYSLVNYLGYVLIYHGDLTMPTWYYVIQPWLATMIGATLFDQVWSRVRRDRQMSSMSRQLVLAILTAVLLGVPFNIARNAAEWLTQDRSDTSVKALYTAAEWARANLPPAAVIGAWNAGTIGYLSNRRVINLDGVVNSWAYYESGRSDLCQYWSKLGITYLVDAFEGDQALSVAPTFPAYARCADRLELIWSDHHYSPDWQLAAYRIH